MLLSLRQPCYQRPPPSNADKTTTTKQFSFRKRVFGAGTMGASRDEGAGGGGVSSQVNAVEGNRIT